jgi:hypothetical protein
MNTSIYSDLIASDVVVLSPLEKYMESRGVTPSTVRQDEYLYYYEKCRDAFYSDIAQRTSRIVAYINKVDENDDKGNALKLALCKHMRNRDFINILRKQLKVENNNVVNGLVGAFICEAVRAYQEECAKLDAADAEAAKDAKKKDDKATAPLKSHVDPEIMEMMLSAGRDLLAPYYSYVQSKCINMQDGHVLAIAALLAMGTEETVPAIIESDIAVTADILNCPLIDNDSMTHIVTGVLRMQKADYVKLSVNQTKFVESLIKWLYKKLDSMMMDQCLTLLVFAYGSCVPTDYAKTCLIQLKDCGTQYPNLRQVAISLKLTGGTK